MPSRTLCPECGEPIKPSWRICPACEMRLEALACPKCKAEVKETWRRCPECEAVLVCPDCGGRLRPGEISCPHCAPVPAEVGGKPSVFSDPVCGMEFVSVSGGLFSMGDTLGEGIENEKPVHDVTLDDFFMARFPVTQAQWCKLMEENPSSMKFPDNPVEQVTWQMACEFADRLAEAVGSGAVFTLPTEAQWEYAARGGKDDLYAGGTNIDAVAWYEANSDGRPHRVGRKKPNAFGLYDMSGNVWEWCVDAFLEDAYGYHSHRNPLVPASKGLDRVMRGGGWNLDAWSARCARRFSLRFDLSGPALGFRLVMTGGHANWAR